MEALLECCCGIDVHRDTLQVCILKGLTEHKGDGSFVLLDEGVPATQKNRPRVFFLCFLTYMSKIEYNHIIDKAQQRVMR